MITEFGNAYKRKDGYYQISSGIHQGKLLHRLVYENNFGSIPKGFHIHHIDGNKENNVPGNLMILSKSNHHSMHMKGRNHPRWNHGRIDAAGGLDFLSASKNIGMTIKEVADDLEYTNAAPVYQYLNNRNLRWNEI